MEIIIYVCGLDKWNLGVFFLREDTWRADNALILGRYSLFGIRALVLMILVELGFDSLGR